MSCTKTILTPLGQYTETVPPPEYQDDDPRNIVLSQVDKINDTIVNQCVDCINRTDIPWVEKFLLIMLLRNGLRVSEIANPGSFELIDKDRFRLYAYKQKRHKICHLYEYSNIKWNRARVDTVRYWVRSRQHYYRIISRWLPYIDTQRTGNQAVTHAGRYLLAQRTYEATRSIDAVKKAIGVVEKDSALHYLSPAQLKDFLIKSINSN